MNKISYPQLVKDIADAYRNAIGSTDSITIGELANKVGEAISRGNSICYKSITYNENNSITLVDEDDNIHNLSFDYEDGVLTNVVYDEKENELIYEDGVLTNVNGKEINLAEVPIFNNDEGQTFNIAYGDEEPTDITKLWIKEQEPSNIIISNNIEGVFSFESKNYLTYNIREMCCASVGDKIYIFGGYTGFSYKNTIMKYNTTTNELTTLTATLKNVCGSMCCASVGDKIYIFDGYGGSYNAYRDIQVFDAITETISTLLTKTTGVWYDRSCICVGNKIYIFGGGYQPNKVSTYSIEVFDIETEEISVLTSAKLSCGAWKPACALVGTKIYIFGGWYWSDSTSYYLDTVQIFDTETETINTLAVTLPIKSNGMACSVIGNKIYLLGGATADGRLNTVYEFDTQTETFKTIDANLIESVSHMGFATIDNNTYIFGGYGESNTSNLISKCTFTHDLAQGSIEIETDLVQNQFNLINTDTATLNIGVKNVYVGDENNNARTAEAMLYKHFDKTITTNYFTGSCFEVKTATELTANIACNTGDLIISAIITRDTLTVSDGWTLISTSETNSTDSNGQRLSFAYKFAESTTETITVTQASSQRLYINMVALQGATDFVDNGYNYVDSEVSSITVAKPDGLTLWACSAPLWSTTSPYSQWTSSNSAYLLDLGTETQSRLGVFLDQTDDESVTFTAGDTTTIIVGSLTIQSINNFITEETQSWDAWTQI
jgi:hypothetical protein